MIAVEWAKLYIYFYKNVINILQLFWAFEGFTLAVFFQNVLS